MQSAECGVMEHRKDVATRGLICGTPLGFGRERVYTNFTNFHKPERIFHRAPAGQIGLKQKGKKVKAEFQQEVAEGSGGGDESVTGSNGFFQRRGQKLGIVGATPLKKRMMVGD